MRYVAATDITVAIPLIDANGVEVLATAVTYSIQDEKGVEISAPVSLVGFVAGVTADITILAVNNALAIGETLGARDIILTCTTASGVAYVSYTYILESVTGRLVRGGNTIATLASADMLASEMSWALTWNTSTRQAKTVALLQAYQNVCKLRYPSLHGTNAYVEYIHPPFERFDLAALSISEVLALDGSFLKALELAQVAEAANLLDNPDQEEQRDDRIVLDTIGEVKRMYRTGKAVTFPICKRAIAYVSRYASLSAKVVGRG